MALKSVYRWMFVLEPGLSSEAALDAINGTINSDTKTAVISSRQTIQGVEMAGK